MQQPKPPQEDSLAGATFYERMRSVTLAEGGPEGVIFTVRGTVRDSDGDPVADAIVVLREDSTNRFSTAVRTPDASRNRNHVHDVFGVLALGMMAATSLSVSQCRKLAIVFAIGGVGVLLHRMTRARSAGMKFSEDTSTPLHWTLKATSCFVEARRSQDGCCPPMGGRCRASSSNLARLTVSILHLPTWLPRTVSI